MNNDLSAYHAVADEIKQMILADKAVKSARVAILGLTFKENCPDTRNSKVADIIARLREYGVTPMVVDPQASQEDAQREYGVTLVPLSSIHDMDCVILAVAHDEFRALTLDQLDALYNGSEKVLVDVKGLFDRQAMEKRGYRMWRL